MQVHARLKVSYQSQNNAIIAAPSVNGFVSFPSTQLAKMEWSYTCPHFTPNCSVDAGTAQKQRTMMPNVSDKYQSTEGCCRYCLARLLKLEKIPANVCI